MCTILNIYFKNMIQNRRQLNKCIGDDTRTMNCTGRNHAGHPLWLPLCDTARTSKCIRNKCIGDDTKAAARQSLNCIKTKKNMVYEEHCVPFNAHVKTAEQRTIMQQYGDWYTGRWWVGCYIWYSEEGPGRAGAPPSPLLAVPNVTAHPSTASVPTNLIWCGTIIASGL